MRLIAIGVGALLLASTGHAQQFRITRPDVEHVEGVDFAGFTHYTWKVSQERGDDPAMHATLVFQIDRALEESGLTRAHDAGEAQLLVRYYTRFERKVRSASTQERVLRPDNQRTTVGFSRGLEGELVIELYRAGDERRLWKGSVAEPTSSRRFTDDQSRRAVELILSEYPPKTRGGEAGPQR